MYLKEVDRALDLIQPHELDNSLRLVHGRGKCFSGLEQLSIDWFAPVILITQFKAIEDFNLNNLVQHLKLYFDKHFSDHVCDCIVFQDRSQAEIKSKVCFGTLPQECFAKEHHLLYDINLLDYKNIGFFLDAQNARHYLSELCENKRVLNLFAYTCAFSVVALASGAQGVVNLDMGQGVLNRGRYNHELNGLLSDSRAVNFIKSDIFKAWKKLHKYGRYDIIIIDPPTLQKGSFSVAKDYKKIIKQLHRLLTPKADIIACLNSPFLGEDYLDELFLEGPLNQGEYSINKRLRIANPKSFLESNPIAGLKAIHYEYKRLSS